MKKINLDKNIKKITDFFNKNKKQKTRSRLILNKIEKDYFPKKRKIINIKVVKLNFLKFFKKTYIPYFLIVSLIWLVFWIFILLWPIFKVKTIEVIKLDNVTSMEISYRSLDIFRWESIFNISERDIFNRLKDHQDNIRSVKLKIKLPDTINIEIWSFRELFNVYLNDRTFILVENGTLIPTTQASQNLRDLNIIKNLDRNAFLEYNRIFEPKYIIQINEIIKLIEENIIDLNLEKFTYYEVEKEIHIETDNETLLIFSLDWFLPIEEQVKNLVIFNKEREQINKNTLRYIDLRIRNRIFYCLNRTLNVCNENIRSIYSQ